MVTEVNIFQIFPRFILDDPDGYAMCRALEAMLNYFLKTCQNGLDIVLDVEKMPEWRLDEMARELNCLYDYGAEVEAKRGWIRDAYKNYRMHGTAEGVRQYLKTYFGESSVNEYWEFGGEAGEFNITVNGVRTTENERWIRRAAEKAKNVRSRLNAIIFNGGESNVEILSGAQTAGIAVVRESAVMS